MLRISNISPGRTSGTHMHTLKNVGHDFVQNLFYRVRFIRACYAFHGKGVHARKTKNFRVLLFCGKQYCLYVIRCW